MRAISSTLTSGRRVSSTKGSRSCCDGLGVGVVAVGTVGLGEERVDWVAEVGEERGAHGVGAAELLVDYHAVEGGWVLFGDGEESLGFMV